MIFSFGLEQATIAEPVKGKMFKGLLVCYTVVISTYFSVGISGYWAFGNQVDSSVLQNFMVGSNPLLPKWFLLMTNGFTVLQVAATTLVSHKIYLLPIVYNSFKTFWCYDIRFTCNRQTLFWNEDLRIPRRVSYRLETLCLD